MFQVYLRRMCIMLLLDWMFCIHQDHLAQRTVPFQSTCFHVDFMSGKPIHCSQGSVETPYYYCIICSVQFSSVAQSRLTLCDPMYCSTPGLPVYHQLPEFTQTYVHRVGDAIQPSHPLSSPSPPTPNPSQHQSFPMSQHFAWGGQSTGVSALASLLPKNTQDWSPLEWTGWISLQSMGLSRVFSNTTVQKHQFFSAQPFL